jgi:hypothetical protein
MPIILMSNNHCIKDGPLATTSYSAEISRIERNRIEVNYYTTITPSLVGYITAGKRHKLARLKEATFMRTWLGIPRQRWIPNQRLLHQGTIETASNDYGEEGYHNARGKLNQITREIASGLDIPHHCGA